MSVHERLMDPEATRDAVNQLMVQRRAEGKMHEPGIQIIPGVEACHDGPVPLAAAVDVLLINRHVWEQFRRIGEPSNESIQQIDAFEATFPAHEDDPLVQTLLAGRQPPRAEPSEE